MTPTKPYADGVDFRVRMTTRFAKELAEVAELQMVSRATFARNAIRKALIEARLQARRDDEALFSPIAASGVEVRP